MRDSYQLLLAEGSSSEARLIVGELRRGGLDVDCHRVATAEGLELALAARSWDFIIFAQLPDLDWATALAICRRGGPDIPFIMVSEQEGESAIQRIMAGVHEHVLIANLGLLPQILMRELRSAQERRIRKQTEMTREWLRQTFSFNALAVVGITLDGIIVSWDANATRLLGYSASEVIGRSMPADIPGDKSMNRQADTTEGWAERVCFGKNGLPIKVQMARSPVEDDVGRIIGASIIMRDLSPNHAGLPLSFGSSIGKPSDITARFNNN